MRRQICLVIKMEITGREVLFSVVIVCIMLVFGIIISGNINDSIMGQCQEYDTALQINNDKELFEYGMRTNIGNAFVYGDLKAVDTVTYPEIGGSYSWVKKVKEEYTRHTKTVTDYDEDGEPVGSHTEVYWTWDEVCSWSKHSKKISFLDVEFNYGAIEFPYSNYITTQKTSSHIRYVYYGTGTKFIGTLYAILKDNTIDRTNFYDSMPINETIECLKFGLKASIVLFWIAWVLLTAGCVAVFYYLDNCWLE